MPISFARKMQRQAERIADDLDSSSILGVKCWYTAAALFERPATRVFVGANPGGGIASAALDEERGYLEWPYRKRTYNAWFDETWEDGGELQTRVHRVFQSMYGQTWEKVLRDTPSFNAVPFRSGGLGDLPVHVRKSTLLWFKQVIDHLKPQLIICNGNNEDKLMSAWSFLGEAYELERRPQIHVSGTYYVKEGEITSPELEGTRIVSFPHLSWAKSGTLFDTIEELGPFA